MVERICNGELDVVGLAALDRPGACEHGGIAIVHHRSAGGIVDVELRVHSRAERVGRNVVVSVVHVVDGNGRSSIRQQSDVDRTVGVRASDAGPAEEEAEHVVERANPFGILFRTEHVTELDGVSCGNEIELEHSGIVDDTTRDGDQIGIAIVR